MSPLGPAGSVALMRALRQNWIRTGSRKQAPRGLAVLLMCGLGLLGACSSDSTVAWAAIETSPGAEAYDGPVERVLDDRLSSRLAEQDLEFVDSRVEYLPPGVNWNQHLAWRSGHAADLTERSERLDLPEPDAPVLETAYSNGTSTLFVIGRADDAGERLVVLTALALAG